MRKDDSIVKSKILCNPFFGSFSSQKSRWLLIGVLIVAAILRLWASWQPVEVLVTKNLPDDAFYYFALAHNTANLGSVTTDGISPTNGFHPLWLISILPLFGRFSPGAELPIHLALTLASFLDLASIWLIARLAADLTRRWEAGILAAWLYAINPIVILQITNGLETALGIFTLMAFLFLVKQWLTEKPKSRFSLLVGFLGGLMFLARSDSVFLFALAMVTALWVWRNKSGLKKVLLASIAALFVVSPWLIWSQMTVGNPIQESGLAVPFAIRARLALQQGGDWRLFLGESLAQLSNAAVWLRGDFSGLPLIVGIAVWGVVVFGLLRKWTVPGSRTEKLILLPLLGSVVALIVFHAGIRWFPRPWYFVPAAIAFALCFAVVAGDYLHKPKIILPATAVITVYFLFAGILFWQVGLYPWQKQMLAANDWLSENIPPQAVVASFNAGIYSYYNDFRVVNLDGVVNHNAYEAVQQREILPYMQGSQVDFLIDFDSVIWREYAPFMGTGFPDSLQAVATVSRELSPDLGFLRLYRVVR